MHVVYDAIDENGRYCGNRLDAKFLSDFNKSYPKMMRSKGWEMDDMDTTDWERYKTDPTYKAERDAKRRSQGKSVNQHIRNRVVKNFIMSEELLKKAQDDTEELRQQKEALEDDIETLRIRKRKLKDKVATTLTEANSDAQTIRDEAERQAEAIMETARQNAQQVLAQREKDLEERDMALTKEFLDVVGDVTGYEYDPETTELDDVKKDLHDWSDELQKYEDETLDKLNKARVALKDAKALESDSDSATLERAREFMRTTPMPNSTTTVLASFEAHERLLGYGKKPRRTRAQIQSSVNDLYNRMNQRQHSDDSISY
jgi:DNA repair exonuclease SbcCD ATPase subunit